MTEGDFWAESVALLYGVRFFAQVTAIAACWLAGVVSLKYMLYVKNHRDLW